MDQRALQAAMAHEGVSGRQLARELGITSQTFYRRMQHGTFGLDDIQVMTKILKLTKDAVVSIFLPEE